ncbi:cytochrome P450 [Protomyces lactucae-debilis]|uniref:Cytochrome P450 n=1 Tax=Protomyces lactucae-debilis TaxID=2754530 RepID=A0A1Y2F5C7_PROLT|nr:cytochrome P450 [Protomyces lactucae-debilis]ORY79092.1 cytochrome P450 [Protomyces lactucae-debilis]
MLHILLVSALAAYVTKQATSYSLLPLIAAFFFLGAFSYYFVWRILVFPRYISKLRAIPGPEGHWFFGEMRQILKEDTGVPHLRWIQDHPEAPLIRYTGLFHQERILLVSSKAHMHVLQQATSFPKPPDISEGLRRILGAKGILFMEGDVHKRQRKQMNPAFAHSHLRSIVPIFLEKANNLIKLWQAGGEIEVLSGLSRATLDIIGSAGFGYEIDSLIGSSKNALADAYSDMFDTKKQSRMLAVLVFYVPFVRKIPVRRHREVDADTAVIARISKELVQNKVQRAQTGQDVGNDILGLLVSDNIRKEKQGDPEDPPMTEEEMSDQTMTLLAAGHETTSAGTTWALLALAEHPEVQSRLRQELQEARDASEEWTFERIESLRYMNNVVKEVLRFYPPVPMTRRQAMEDAVIEGYSIPKGTNIFICAAAINKNPHVWGYDAHLFNPDRYDNLPAAVTNYSTETFLHGTRSCIGQRFATVEMKCLLMRILLAFEVKTKPGYEVKVQASITSRPKGGLPLILTPLEKA